MATPSSLEGEAAVCRLQASRLEGVVAHYLDPALRLLPQAWLGPAADQLEQDLFRYRETVRSVRWELRNRAIRLEAEAAAMRATETVGSPSGVVVDVV